MNPLLEKRKKARQSKVEAGGHVFTIMRPTDGDMMRLRGADDIEAISRFVVGWSDSVSSLALGIPGGDSMPVPFDKDLFRDWLEDQPELWPVLSAAILEAYKAHHAAVEDAEKN